MVFVEQFSTFYSHFQLAEHSSKSGFAFILWQRKMNHRKCLQYFTSLTIYGFQYELVRNKDKSFSWLVSARRWSCKLKIFSRIYILLRASAKAFTTFFILFLLAWNGERSDGTFSQPTITSTICIYWWCKWKSSERWISEGMNNIKSMIDCIFGTVHERNIIHTQEVETRFITTRFSMY